MMDTFDAKGQTALEYLLVVVVALSMVILVLMWMQSTSTQLGGAAKNQTDKTICGTTECNVTGDVRCNIAACGSARWCNVTIRKCQTA